MEVAIDGAAAARDTRIELLSIVTHDVNNPLQSLIVLLELSVDGDTSLQPAAEAVREHAFDYLTKSVSREQLVSTVTRAVESRRQHQARVSAEQRLHEEHRVLAIRHRRTAMLLSVLYNRAVEAILVLDKDGRLVDASDSFVALVGRPLHDLLDACIRELFDPHQIGLNLLTNAVDALGDGGGAERGSVSVRMSYDGDFGVLRVTDSGAGIPEGMRARVFEPFFTTKGSGGTGLGLPVVLDIVRSLGGRVALDVPEGGGTIVTVSIPKYRPDAGDPPSSFRAQLWLASPLARRGAQDLVCAPMPVLGVLLSAENARAGSPDERVGLVLLERTLLEPPRLAAMQRWSAAVRRRFPNAQQMPFVWHLVSHAREDGLRERSTRRPAGDEIAFGGLQTTDEVQRAWEVTRLCMQGCGSTRVMLRTGPSLTPGALGRKRLRAFVEARKSEGIAVTWEPEGLWETEAARVFARELGVGLCVGAFEGGRPRYEELTDGGHSQILVGRDVWLRIGGTGPRARLDGQQIDAIADHVAAVPDTTLIFTGPRALQHLREVTAFLAV